MNNHKGASVNGVEKKTVLSTVLDTIAGIFGPVLPAITGAGMLKAVLAILTALKLISTTSQEYHILHFISEAGFYFLPILLAYTSAIKFKCSPAIAMVLGGVLLSPEFRELVAAGKPVTFFGLPVTLASYSASVIPIILTVWLMSYVERFVDKVSPDSIKFLAKSLITLIVVAPISLIVIGPIGTILGNYLAVGIDSVNQYAGWLVPLLMGAFGPLLVITGTHYSLFPVVITSLATHGFDTVLTTGMLASNIAQGAAAFCVALRTKNKDFKQLASSAGITAVLGITEPAMYGVNLKLKKPFTAVLIGGSIGGLYAGIVGLKGYVFAIPGLAALPIYIGPNPFNLINAIITVIISFVATFALTWFLGFEDVVDEENNKKVEIQPLKNKINIPSPLVGHVVSLDQVSDETFASGIIGKGIAVIPTEGKVVSPVNGKVEIIFKTKHAIGIVSEDGSEILIHIGLGTIKLGGNYFTTNFKVGDTVKVGDTLVEFDIDGIKAEGYDVTSPIVITNTYEYFDVVSNNDIKQVKEGETLLTIM